MTKNNVTKIDQLSLSVIDLDITDIAIMELKERHVAIPVTNKKELEIVQKSITELTSYRTKVEKKRKEIKQDALDFGRRVDAEAKRITILLEEIEKPLIDVKQAFNVEQERIRQEEEQKEKDRVAAIGSKIDNIRDYPLSMAGRSSEEIAVIIGKFTEKLALDTFNYEEFTSNATEAKEHALDQLNKILAERITEEQEQAAHALRLKQEEDARAQLEIDQAKLREEQRIFEERKAELDRAELERAAAARERLAEADRAAQTEALERQKKENERLAAIEEKRLSVEREQLELDRQKAAHEAKVNADKAQAEYEELQRQQKEKTMLEQAAPVMFEALVNIEKYLSSGIGQQDAHCLEIARMAINAAKGIK